MKKEIKIDSNNSGKYEIEGKCAFSGRLKTDRVYTIVDKDGLIKQSTNLHLSDLYALVDAKKGDKIKISIEKL